jgi:hypothetical protein
MSVAFVREESRAAAVGLLGNGPIDLNHTPRRLTSAQAQALGAIESRPAWQRLPKCLAVSIGRRCARRSPAARNDSGLSVVTSDNRGRRVIHR